MQLFDGIVELRYADNDDTAFSILRTLGIARTPFLLIALSAAALIGVVVAWYAASRKQGSTLQHLGFALVLGGALGNLVDRTVHGFVVDFIHVAHWPIFNVADVAVCVGLGVLLIGRRVARERGVLADGVD
ncbi:MAG: hypothetical protein NVS3B20_01350 [Polyangiales bacterium]